MIQVITTIRTEFTENTQARGEFPDSADFIARLEKMIYLFAEKLLG